MTFLWRVGDAKNQRLFGFLLSAKQVSAYGTQSWVEIGDDKSLRDLTGLICGCFQVSDQLMPTGGHSIPSPSGTRRTGDLRRQVAKIIREFLYRIHMQSTKPWLPLPAALRP